MRFHVAQLLKESTGATRSYEVQEADVVVTDDGARSRVEGNLKLLRTKSGVLVDATLRLRYPDVCSRCLAAIEVPVELHIEEEYQPTVDILTGAASPRPEDPSTFLIDAHHVLDLTEAGLCPVCGQNLNEATCACPHDEYDPRWRTLATLARGEPDEK
jgi:uncharacterized protein